MGKKVTVIKRGVSPNKERTVIMGEQ